eukprot:TRINITY_DN5946_c0_g1_i1.p1 TRINITY_DN5946_c0_g1~~TRINITY_DN5946_c0_g1_i1.p1  ORF type:complete len:1755 (+),score=242.88 TRINITY_DN5946_c0_g1_i1:43-5307(+)
METIRTEKQNRSSPSPSVSRQSKMVGYGGRNRTLSFLTDNPVQSSDGSIAYLTSMKAPSAKPPKDQHSLNARESIPTDEAPSDSNQEELKKVVIKEHFVKLLKALFEGSNSNQGQLVNGEIGVKSKLQVQRVVDAQKYEGLLHLLHLSKKEDIIQLIFRELRGKAVKSAASLFSSLVIMRDTLLALPEHPSVHYMMNVYHYFCLMIRLLREIELPNPKDIHLLLETINSILQSQYWNRKREGELLLFLRISMTFVDAVVDSPGNRDTITVCECLKSITKKWIASPNIFIRFCTTYIHESVKRLSDYSIGDDPLFIVKDGPNEVQATSFSQASSQSLFCWGAMSFKLEKCVGQDLSKLVYMDYYGFYEWYRLFQTAFFKGKSGLLTSLLDETRLGRKSDPDSDFSFDIQLSSQAGLILVVLDYYLEQSESQQDGIILEFILAYYDSIKGYEKYELLSESVEMIMRYFSRVSNDRPQAYNNSLACNLPAFGSTDASVDFLSIFSLEKTVVESSLIVTGREEDALKYAYQQFLRQSESSLLENYIDIQVCDDDPSAKSKNASEKVDAFLKDTHFRVCTILGGSGAGKTTFSRSLVKSLWDKWIENHNYNWIPFFIPLINVSDPINSLISYMQPPNQVFDFWSILKKRKCVLVLDGFDEISVYENIIKQFQTGAYSLKFIITYRSQVDLNDRALEWFSPYKGNKPQCDLVKSYMLKPFDSEQISNYFKKYCDSRLGGISSETLEKLARSMPGVNELLKVPYFLYMVAEMVFDAQKVANAEATISAIQIPMVWTIHQVYARFISLWIKRQESKVSHKLTAIQDSIIEYQKSFAKALHLSGKTSVTYTTPSANTSSGVMQMDPSAIAFQRLFSNAGYMPLIRSCSLLRQIQKTPGVFEFSFMHRSFLDYFVSLVCIDELEQMEEKSNICLEVFSNDHIMRTEVIEFLADMASTDQRIQQKLLLIVNRSKFQDGITFASSNALKTLCHARVSLANKDFQGIFAENCDLRGCNLSKINFAGARLKGAQLANSCLYNTCFDRADLTDVGLGTLPSIKMDSSHEVDDIEAAMNSEMLIVTKDRLMVRYPFEFQSHYSISKVDGVHRIFSLNHKIMERSHQFILVRDNGVLSFYDSITENTIDVHFHGGLIDRVIPILVGLSETKVHVFVKSKDGPTAFFCFDTELRMGEKCFDWERMSDFKDVVYTEHKQERFFIVGNSSTVRVYTLNFTKTTNSFDQSCMILTREEQVNKLEALHTMLNDRGQLELYLATRAKSQNTEFQVLSGAIYGDWTSVLELGTGKTVKFVHLAGQPAYVLLITSKTITVYDLESRRFLQSITYDLHCSLHRMKAFVRDGQSILATFLRSEVDFHVLDSKLSLKSKNLHKGSVNAIEYRSIQLSGREMEFVFTCSSDGRLSMWDYSTSGHSGTIFSNQVRIKRLCITQDNIFACLNHRVDLDVFSYMPSPGTENYSVLSSEPPKTSNGPDEIKDMCLLSFDENLVVCVTANRIKVFKSTVLETFYKGELDEGESFSAVTVCGGIDKRIIAVSSTNAVYIANDTEQSYDKIPCDEYPGLDDISRIAPIPTDGDDTLYAIVSASNCLSLLVIDTVKNTTTYYTFDKKELVAPVAFQLEGDWWLCAGDDKGFLHFGKIEFSTASYKSGSSWLKLTGTGYPAHKSEILCLSYIKKDNVILSGSSDCSFKAWSIEKVDQDNLSLLLKWSVPQELTAFGVKFEDCIASESTKGVLTQKKGTGQVSTRSNEEPKTK